MTHNLTQNRKIADGVSGANRMEKDMVSDTIRTESTENICSPPVSAAHNPEVAGSSPAAATIISAESYDSAEISLVFRTFSLCSLLRFSSDPNRDPYGETSGNYWRAPERILPIVLAASFFAEVVTWV